MRAMVLEKMGLAEEKPLRLTDVPVPEAGAGELLLKVLACGVCRTDLHIVEGELVLPKLPVIPGHEVVAEVAQVGQGVEGFEVGERVGVPWLHDTPEDCVWRQRGQENLCPEARFTGYHVDGGYAEYMVSRAEFTYLLPEGYSDAEAAPLLCAGVIGYRALKLSELKPGYVFGIYGFGGSAHITIQVAVSWGCPVYVFTRKESHRQLARELGAEWTGGLDDEPPGPVDSAINFTPAGPVVLTALRHLRPGGTVCCAGIYQSPIPEMDYGLLYGERTLRSAANSTREDVRELLAEAEKVGIRTSVVTYPLEEANEALAALKHSEIDGAAVLVM
ncbi:MAG: zinc-dependent alcohol dehydrogenase family protein [Armatimonadia bacterium]